jgi:hypothetical protein
MLKHSVIARAAALALVGFAATLTTIGSAISAGPINESAFDRCRAISNDAARLRCFESLTGEDNRSQPVGPQSIGRWRLVRTPHPQGGKDAISIVRSGEFAGSDPDFAGLMIRCGEHDIEVLIAVIRPFGARAHPKVTLETGATSTFDAAVVSPGVLLLLPTAVSAMARGAWLTASNVTVSVTDEQQQTIRGKVLLADLSPALNLLQASCADR